MSITRQKKETILKDLAEQIKKAQMIIFVNFHGLNTAATRKLRNLIRLSAGKYQVAKKTLIKKALEKLDVSGIIPSLQGEIGVITGGDDVTALTKNLVKFIKEHKELVISGGILENNFIGPKMVSELATIPSREILLAKLAYTLNSPARRLVGAMGGDLRKFVMILSQISRKNSR